MLRVEKPVVWDNIEYTGYEIYSVEWVLGKNQFFCVVVYLSKSKKYSKVVKHKFDVTDDVDINDIINKVHQLHNG